MITFVNRYRKTKIMIKKLIFVGLLLVAGTTIAQEKKTFTLAESVTQQYRKFAPETMPFFQWIPGTTEFSYLDGYVKLKKGNTKGELKDWLTIQEVNTALNAQLPWFSGFEWRSKNTFLVNDGTKFYSFNVDTKSGQLLVDLGDDAENASLHAKALKVAYTIQNNLLVNAADGQKIRITNNEDKNIVSGQTYARSEFGITHGIFWSPSGNLLAFAQKDESEVHDYPLLDITETPGKLQSIKYPMAGQKSEKPAIGIFDFATKNTIFIRPRSSEDAYLTNVSWSPDETFLLIAEVNRDQNHMWLNKYDAKTGAFLKTLFEEKNDKWIEPEHPAFFPSETSTNFVWISERDGFNNLYYYNADGKLIKQLTSNKFVVKEIVKSTNKGTEIVFAATGESPLNTMYYAVSLAGKQRLLTPISGTHAIEISDDAKWIFDQYSNHDTPNVAQLLDGSGKLKKELLRSDNKLKDYAIGPREIGTITANDGSILYTRMIKPSNFDPSKKYPVMVYVYGGPHAQMITNSWYDGANLWMHWMAEQGYLVYTVDNRGSAERGFAFESQIHRQLGTVEMEDQLTGVAYLKSLPYVDANRLAVHGWSFGGFMTTSLMLRQAGVFQVGVAGGPVTDWSYYEAMYGERYMDRPEENEEGYATSNLLNHAEKLKGDLLLIHGTIDDVVVMQHNLALVKKFVEAGIQMDFFPYPMHKHNVGGKDRVHLIEKILTYILENNQ
jgi:dipeptidyl-peptidase-4